MYSPPIDQRNGLDLTGQALGDLFVLGAAPDNGGFFPVGLNNLWHGGVHLTGGLGMPIHAAAGGRLVAARLGSEESLYGSSDFVLTRHRWPPFAAEGEGTPFWMLYMHLAGKEQRPQSLREAARSADWVPWLRSEPILEVAVDTLNTRDEPAGTVDGSVERNARLVARSEPQPKDGYLWREVDVPGVPYAQYVATRTEDGNETYVRVRGPTVDEDTLQALMSGDVVALDAPVAAGDMLWWSGAFGLPSGEVAITDAYERGPTVHWEVFAADKAFGHEDGAGDGSEAGSWSVFEDQNDDHRLDPREVEAAGQLQDRWAESTAAETDTFAEAPAEERSPFFIMESPWSRRIAARFRSEWGVSEIETVMADEKGYEADGRAAMKRLQWWEEAIEARSSAGYSVELPDDSTVWHYHPVGALEALRPQFTAEGDSTTLDGPVETIEDVAEQVIGALGYNGDLSSLSESEFDRVRSEMHGMPINVAAPAPESEEHFANVEFKPSSVGYKSFNGTPHTFGIAESGHGDDDPDFYTLLQDSGREGLPERSFDRNVWAALSESEGSLRAINTWDAAFLSAGPFQHTAGRSGGKGELPGVMDTVRENVPEAYWRHFGRFGLKPVGAEISGGAKRAHFELHGEVLDTAEKKRQLRRFKWPHRFREALKDEEISQWLLTEGFRRLELIRNREMTLNVTPENQEEPVTIDTTIGQLFQRDLSQALVLDWHINAPAYVWPKRGANQWIGAVEGLLKKWDVTSASDLLVGSSVTEGERENRERQLAAALLEARLGDEDGSMTAPARRAIDILKYTENNVVEELARTDQPPEEPKTVPAFLTRVLNLDENPSHTGEGAWSGIQNHDAKVLSFESES